MKVNIGKYLSFIGPYQIADMVFFWTEKYPENDKLENRWDYKLRDKFGDWLANDVNGNDSLLAKLCLYVYNKRERKIRVHIDDYDVWNMYHTLSIIILPMLKKLKECKHGSGMIDPKDVPEHLRFDEHTEWNDNLCFDFYHETTPEQPVSDIHIRYEWVLDEMIWTFEQLCDENCEDKFWLERGEIDLEKYPEDDGKTLVPIRWKKKSVIDYEGLKTHQDRIQNGLRLFGVYYQTLWD